MCAYDRYGREGQLKSLWVVRACRSSITDAVDKVFYVILYLWQEASMIALVTNYLNLVQLYQLILVICQRNLLSDLVHRVLHNTLLFGMWLVDDYVLSLLAKPSLAITGTLLFVEFEFTTSSFPSGTYAILFVGMPSGSLTLYQIAW
jgi:hypothetical protein